MKYFTYWSSEWHWNNIIKIILLLLCSALVSEVRCQEIRGRVSNESGEPVPFANVYLANTMVGTTTNAEGLYVLKGFPPGKYDLTVSFVGYQTFSESLQIDAGQTIERNIVVKISVTELPDVYVKADNRNWQQNFTVFRKYFLGEGPSSYQCEILEKRNLYFYFDEASRTLYAHASQPVEIRNEWLGYAVYYDMQSFELDYRYGRLAFYGIPRFVELEPKNARMARKWEKNRRDAFYGSMQHFFRGLANHSLDSAGFVADIMKKVPNPERRPESEINLDIREVKVKQKAANSSFEKEKLSNELSLLLEERQKPEMVLEKDRTFNGNEFLQHDGNFDFTGVIRVQYNLDGNQMQRQVSDLYIEKPLVIYSNGYYDDIRSTYVEGFWSKSGSMSQMLPLEYQP